MKNLQNISQTQGFGGQGSSPTDRSCRRDARDEGSLGLVNRQNFPRYQAKVRLRYSMLWVAMTSAPSSNLKTSTETVPS